MSTFQVFRIYRDAELESNRDDVRLTLAENALQTLQNQIQKTPFVEAALALASTTQPQHSPKEWSRPPKDTAGPSQPAPPPKKRGRPPKGTAKTLGPAPAPKKRGRPRKDTAGPSIQAPALKKRGRPPQNTAKPSEQVLALNKRGCPPKDTAKPSEQVPAQKKGGHHPKPIFKPFEQAPAPNKEVAPIKHYYQKILPKPLPIAFEPSVSMMLPKALSANPHPAVFISNSPVHW